LNRQTILTLVLATILLINGCIPTKNPPFKAGDLLIDPIFEGNWSVLSGPAGNDKSSLLDITKKGDHYAGKWRDGSDLGDIYFFSYNNIMYVSMSAEKFEKDLSINYHTYKLSISGEVLKVWWVNDAIAANISRARDAFLKNPNTDDQIVKTVGKLVGSDTAHFQSVVLNRPAKEGYTFDQLTLRAKPIGRRLSDSPLFGKKQRTMDYWVESDILIKSIKKSSPPDERLLNEEFRRISQGLKDLPTLGVDLEAVSSRLLLSHALDEAIDYFNKGNRILDILVRTLNGDPFGPAQDDVQEHKQMVQKMADAQKRTETVRALLTAKYDAEYP
jgi:hypothetical protein